MLSWTLSLYTTTTSIFDFESFLVPYFLMAVFPKLLINNWYNIVGTCVSALCKIITFWRYFISRDKICGSIQGDVSVPIAACRVRCIDKKKFMGKTWRPFQLTSGGLKSFQTKFLFYLRLDLGAAQSSISDSTRNFFGSLNRLEPNITAQQQSCTQSNARPYWTYNRPIMPMYEHLCCHLRRGLIICCQSRNFLTWLK